MTPNLDYEQLNQQVEEALKRRKKMMRYVFFGVHAMMFVVFTLLMWIIATTTPGLSQAGDDLIGLLMLPTMGWLSGIVFHGISTLADSGVMDQQIRKEVISKELGSLILDQALQGKAKRRLEEEDQPEEEQEVMLSDDGELIHVNRRQSK